MPQVRIDYISPEHLALLKEEGRISEPIKNLIDPDKYYIFRHKRMEEAPNRQTVQSNVEI